MKKTLIAASIAALAAGSAQASVAIYESDSTTVSSYGKLQLELENLDGDNTIQSNGSRFGFNSTSALDNGMEAFANMEFRFNAGAQNTQALTIRNSFLGVQGDFGRIRVGNFDGVYYDAVSSVNDIMENRGYRALNEGDDRSRGAALAFDSAEYAGVSFGLQARHYQVLKLNALGVPAVDAWGNTSNKDEWNLQAYVQFAPMDSLTLALAFDQNNKNTTAGTRTNPYARNVIGPAPAAKYDTIIGASATLELDPVTVSALVENAGDLMHAALAASFDYGMGDIYGTVSFLDADGYAQYGAKRINQDGMTFAVGANYNLSSNFYTYAEVAIGDDTDRSTASVTTNSFASPAGAPESANAITIGAAYNW